MITCSEIPIAFLLCNVFLRSFVAFPNSFPGRLFYLVVSIPDLCLLLSSTVQNCPHSNTLGSKFDLDVK